MPAVLNRAAGASGTAVEAVVIGYAANTIGAVVWCCLGNIAGSAASSTGVDVVVVTHFDLVFERAIAANIVGLARDVAAIAIVGDIAVVTLLDRIFDRVVAAGIVGLACGAAAIAVVDFVAVIARFEERFENGISALVVPHTNFVAAVGIVDFVAIVAALEDRLKCAVAANIVALAEGIAAIAVVNLVAVVAGLGSRDCVITTDNQAGIWAAVKFPIRIRSGIDARCIDNRAINKCCAAIKTLRRAFGFAPAIVRAVIATWALVGGPTCKGAGGLWSFEAARPRR